MRHKKSLAVFLFVVLWTAVAHAQCGDFVGKIPPPLTVKEYLNVKGGKPPDLKGKVVMYEFWTTWCGVCKRAIPQMIHIDQTYRKKGLVLLGITYEERNVVEKFLKTSKITYPIGLDHGMEMVTAYGVQGVPSAYILDVNGRVMWNGQPEALTDEQLDRLLHEGLRGGEIDGGSTNGKELPPLAFDKVGQGPPVVFIHGLGGSARDWDKIAHVWSENLTVYTVDLYGHGRTPPLSTDKPLTVADMARGVLQFIRREKIERPVLVGHSLGGLIALQLAEVNPSAFMALVIVDVPPAPKVFVTKSSIAADRESLAADAEKFIRERWGKMATRPPDVEHVVKSALATDRKTFQDIYFDIRATDLRPEIGSLRLPVLVFYAEPPGGFTPTDDPEKLYDGVPEMSLSTVSGVRHFIMLDAPQNFTVTAFRFLAKTFKKNEEGAARERSVVKQE